MDGEDEIMSGVARRRPPAKPWMIAAAYALLAVVLAAAGFGGLWRELSVMPELAGTKWYSLITALPAAAIVLLRQRAPWLGFVLMIPILVADALTVGGLVPLLVVLEMFHSGIVQLDRQQRQTVMVWGIAGLVAVVLTIQALLGELRLTVLVGLQIGALFGMTYWYANSVAQSRELVALYRQRAEDAARITELDRIAAVQEERDRMASELHDIVAGHVAAVAIRSEAALSAHGDAPAGDATAEASQERAALRAVRDSSLQAHEALRSMIAVLRDGSVAPAVPLGRAQLPGLVAEARRSGLRVELQDTWVGDLPVSIDHGIGRIVQESLSNSAKHDAGGDVVVRVAASGPEVRVSVVSRGGRALPHPGLRGNGIGLQGLESRVHALGGSFTAGEVDGAWSVSARLPVGGADNARGATAPLSRDAAAAEARDTPQWMEAGE